MGIVKAVDFKGMLIELANKIEEGDSFEGSLSYTRLTPGLEHGELEVTVTARVGNLEGQGGMLILEASKLDENGGIVGREAQSAKQRREMEEFFGAADKPEDPKG